MNRHIRFLAVIRTVIIGLALIAGLPAGLLAAEEGVAMGGWEIDGEYNRHYKNSERDRIKGVVEEITEVTPLPGMTPGIALIVKDSEGERVTVHLAPRWYEQANPSGLRKGDQVKIKGVWAEMAGKEVFMAAKVKWNENEAYKVRQTKTGKPFWTMDPEEHAAEVAETEAD